MTLWDYVKAIFSISVEKRNQTLSETKVLTMYTSLTDRMKDNVSAMSILSNTFSDIQ